MNETLKSVLILLVSIGLGIAVFYLVMFLVPWEGLEFLGYLPLFATLSIISMFIFRWLLRKKFLPK